MKYLLITLLLFPFISFSQSNYEDVVYLKNGSIIHGTIIEQVPNVSLKIKTRSGDVIFYKLEEVEKFTKEEAQPQSKRVKSEPSPVAYAAPEKVAKTPFAFDSVKIKTTGTIEFGGLIGLPSVFTYVGQSDQFSSHLPATTYSIKRKYRMDMFEIRFIIDKMLNRRLSVGGGINIDASGQDAVTGFESKASVITPVYFNIKYSFLKKKVSPFIAGQAGAAFYAGSYIGGGAMGAFQFGLKGYVSQRVAMNLSIGYRFQHLAYRGEVPYTDDQGNNTVLQGKTQNSYANFISILFGITF